VTIALIDRVGAAWPVHDSRYAKRRNWPESDQIVRSSERVHRQNNTEKSRVLLNLQCNLVRSFADGYCNQAITQSCHLFGIFGVNECNGIVTSIDD
jgi:hypothetical protein